MQGVAVLVRVQSKFILRGRASLPLCRSFLPDLHLCVYRLALSNLCLTVSLSLALSAKNSDGKYLIK